MCRCLDAADARQLHRVSGSLLVGVAKCRRVRENEEHQTGTEQKMQATRSAALVSVILWLDMAGLCQLHHSSATLFTGSGTTAKLESGGTFSRNHREVGLLRNVLVGRTRDHSLRISWDTAGMSEHALGVAPRSRNVHPTRGHATGRERADPNQILEDPH